MTLRLRDKLEALLVAYALLATLMASLPPAEREVEKYIVCEDGRCTPVDPSHVTVIYKD
jgi:hypothetical protein